MERYTWVNKKINKKNNTQCTICWSNTLSFTVVDNDQFLACELLYSAICMDIRTRGVIHSHWPKPEAYPWFQFRASQIQKFRKVLQAVRITSPHKASSLRAPTLARKNWDWVLYQGCKHVAATDPTAARRRNRTMVAARKVFAFRKDFAKIPPQPWHENPGKRARMPNRLIWLSLEFENI